MMHAERRKTVPAALPEAVPPPVSPDGLLQLGLGMMGAKALLSGVELGVFAELARGGPRGLTALADAVGLHPRAARDYLDALVALKVLDRTDGPAPRYANCPATDAFLDPAKPTYVGGLLEMANSRLYPAWGKLTDALRTGRPQNEVGHLGPEEAFAAIYDTEAHVERFAKAMTGISLGNAAALADRLPWDRVRTVADVGCAEGAVPVTLAKAHPHLRAIGFDLPAVRPVFERYAARHGVGDRARFVGGDFFADELPPADVLVFGHILHDWDLPTKRMLLCKAYDALPPGGQVVVYDAMIDDDRRHNSFGLLMSLNMLVETPGGFDYTHADCRRWLGEAGFEDVRVEPLTGPHSVAVATRA